MRIRSILTTLFIAYTISCLFFLPNLSLAEDEPTVEELIEKIEVLTETVEVLTETVENQGETIVKQGEQITVLTETVKKQGEQIKALETDQQEEDRQDVINAYNTAAETAMSAIPGSETVMIPKKAAEALAADRAYQEKYGESPITGVSVSDSCSPPPVYFQHHTGEGNQPGQYEVDGYGRKTYH